MSGSPDYSDTVYRVPERDNRVRCSTHNILIKTGPTPEQDELCPQCVIENTTPLCPTHKCNLTIYTRSGQTIHFCEQCAAELPPPLQGLYGYNCAGEIRPQYTYSRPRATDALTQLRQQSELLSRYAAHLETLPTIQRSNDSASRATLAREMSCIFFRAAELEEKS